ncbi:AI-2E family transporter [Nonomuraea muscovyensis]|uniref:Putative PurR-regulated permease PerM n=1 Tax=Nonomuraea muscovyensis TaxID=1124761 RepID=A0A7X0CB96_9ACTN|nr:AI-2E family transporter [Nonomuraea muscovyensis]MBB6351834.1 putative PurR-regulated permease PerM [Nonomuraea muscovyensis]MDF2708826.1 family transporter [Nonomuraea muscovyensis]
MRAWRALGWIAIIAVGLFLFQVLRTVVISVIVGVFITALLLPPARWLMRRGLNRALATAVVFVSGLLVGGAFIALLVPPTIASVSDLSASLGKAVTDLNSLAAGFGLNGAAVVDQVGDYLSKQGQTIATGALTGVRTAGEILVGTVLALILAVYFVHGGDRLFRWLVELTPVQARRTLVDSGELIFTVIGRYIRGVALVGLVDGFFIGLALWIMGVPLALPLAVLTFVGSFLPVVGAFAAGLLAAVVAFVAKGWLVALIVVAVTVLVQQLEGHVLAPQIYGRALDLPGAVIILAIAVGSLVAGIIGAFLAAPVTSVVVALLHRNVTAAEGAPAPARAGPGSHPPAKESPA